MCAMYHVLCCDACRSPRACPSPASKWSPCWEETRSGKTLLAPKVHACVGGWGGEHAVSPATAAAAADVDVFAHHVCRCAHIPCTTASSLGVSSPLCAAARCPNDACRHDQAYFQEVQIRSADEPATLFFRCTKCAVNWREG